MYLFYNESHLNTTDKLMIKIINYVKKNKNKSRFLAVGVRWSQDEFIRAKYYTQDWDYHIPKALRHCRVGWLRRQWASHWQEKRGREVLIHSEDCRGCSPMVHIATGILRSEQDTHTGLRAMHTHSKQNTLFTKTSQNMCFVMGSSLSQAGLTTLKTKQLCHHNLTLLNISDSVV